VIDCHCHLDQYPDPVAVALSAERVGVGIVAVTSLPSHFAVGREPAARLRRARLAIGLHPLLADHHAGELDLFARLVDATSYIGEVGLDFSREGRPSRDRQERSFRYVLARIQDRPRFLSLHSRGAEQAVFDLLGEFDIRSAVFHWFSGSPELAATIAARGHFFSVNPAMLRSPRGRDVVRAVPESAVLTETDGPYVQIAGRPARPEDVLDVVSGLARMWNFPDEAIRHLLSKNLGRAMAGVEQPQFDDLL
jgi:TatD DNase family protein